MYETSTYTCVKHVPHSVGTSGIKSNRNQCKTIEWKQVTVTLTLSVGLHSRCRVDSISKQTVSGHFQADHTGTDWTYKTQAKYSHILQWKQNNHIWHASTWCHDHRTIGVKMFLNRTTEVWVNTNWATNALNYSDNAKYQPTHAAPFLLHVKCLNKNMNSAAMIQSKYCVRSLL